MSASSSRQHDTELTTSDMTTPQGDATVKCSEDVREGQRVGDQEQAIAKRQNEDSAVSPKLKKLKDPRNKRGSDNVAEQDVGGEMVGDPSIGESTKSKRRPVLQQP